MDIETILFDLDGTLLDSNELISMSFEHTFEKYGYEFSQEEILSFNGPPLVDTFKKINSELADDMIKTYRAHNHEIHDDYVKLFPNVIETLAALKEEGIKLGVVSAKMRQGVELGLEITGTKRYFDSIVTADDIVNAKPHPEPVLKGMTALEGQAATTMMVGDNYHDIQAGQRAGVYTAGVAWSAKGADFLASYKPTIMLEDMRDLLKYIEV